MTKVEGLKTESRKSFRESPPSSRSWISLPATLSQVHGDARLQTLTPRKTLGHQLSLFDTAMADGAVYLDLCLIFLLFLFSLSKRMVLTKIILQSRRHFPAAAHKHLTCACASFATAKQMWLQFIFWRHIHHNLLTRENIHFIPNY